VKLSLLLVSRWFLSRFILRPWRWRQYFLLKRRFNFNGLNGVASQQIEFFTTTSVRTSNHTSQQYRFLTIHCFSVPRNYVDFILSWQGKFGITEYCDTSTHCWVAQLVSMHRPVNKISAQTRWRHATVLEYGSYATCRDDVTRTRNRGIWRDLRVSASDATQPSPGSLLRYRPGNRQQWRSYDWGLYKRNWNV
jgi:hypothetical protein